MGTHPIFESDFDCLTEMLSRITRIISRNYFFSRCRFGFLEETDPRFYMNLSFFEQSGLFRLYNWSKGHDFYKNVFDCQKFGPGMARPGPAQFEKPEIYNLGSNKTLFGKDLAFCTKIALQGLINGLENEDSDISEMFCPRRPGLEKKLRKQWKMLSRNDKIFFGEEIFDDCRIFAKKFDTFDGEQFLMAFIWCRVSKLPERYQYASVNGEKLTKHGDKWGYHYTFHVYFRYDENTAQWQLQMINNWPIYRKYETSANLKNIDK